MEMYRAVRVDGFDANKVYTWRPGARLPGNVPYLIDNLWELARPPERPSRRAGVYASPTPALALASATAGNLARREYVACRVKLNGTPKVFQLSESDARYHPDLKNLQRLVHAALDDWSTRSLVAKLALAPLFLPGITRIELEEAMAGNSTLCDLTERLVAAGTMWNDAPNIAEGEIIFELAQGDTYTLEAV